MAGLEHTDREYEHELLQLREQLLVMGSHVESIIGDSIHALLERDTKLAERTILADKIVDRMEVELDGLCLQILARHCRPRRERLRARYRARSRASTQIVRRHSPHGC